MKGSQIYLENVYFSFNHGEKTHVRETFIKNQASNVFLDELFNKF